MEVHGSLPCVNYPLNIYISTKDGLVLPCSLKSLLFPYCYLRKPGNYVPFIVLLGTREKEGAASSKKL